MTALGGFNYTPEIVTNIQNEVKKYLECDDILTEYISVMVRNNKTKEEMSNDLSDFIGTEKANEFANWLWNFIPSYFDSIKPATAIPSSPSTSTQKKPPTQRLILNAVKQATEDTRNVRVPMADESLDDIIENNDNNTNNNNNINNNNNNNNKKEYIKKDKFNNNNNNNNKKKNGQPNFTITMNDINNNNNVNNSASKKRKNINRDEEDEENSNNNNNNTNNNTEDPINIDSVSTKKPKKERCTYWPLCRNADACIYHHPTTQCLLFPNCTYGDKCLYIHPSIPCKFGANCTNTECVYNHPQRPAGSASGAPPAMNEIPCRHGFACPNKKTGCGFYHPPPACKFGASCNMGKACPFGHGKPCTYGVNCTTPNCYFSHHVADQPMPDCKFGKDCTNPKCKFIHTEERDIDKVDMNTDQLSSTLPSTPPPKPDEDIIQEDQKIQEPIDV